ncbi:transposase [Botrimarina hoheduenensis]|uniref:transposase n=1 Tax=Botrimarina hoheduenensis TaxID=2528000 RepID=UPI0037049B29
MIESKKRRSYDEAFKREAVRLVVEEKYSFARAAEAVGVSEQSLREWRTSRRSDSMSDRWSVGNSQSANHNNPAWLNSVFTGTGTRRPASTLWTRFFSRVRSETSRSRRLVSWRSDRVAGSGTQTLGR